jgi:hypothetical protein
MVSGSHSDNEPKRVSATILTVPRRFAYEPLDISTDGTTAVAIA